MNPDKFLALDVIILLIALIVLVWALKRDWRESGKTSDVARAVLQDLRKQSAEGPEVPRSLQAITRADLTPDEFQASLVSEQIEELVKQRLRSYEDLVEVDFDFGSAEDGSLEIWVAGERYRDIEEISDPRIRTAIAEAVQAFNRSLNEEV